MASETVANEGGGVHGSTQGQRVGVRQVSPANADGATPATAVDPAVVSRFHRPLVTETPAGPKDAAQGVWRFTKALLRYPFRCCLLARSNERRRVLFIGTELWIHVVIWAPTVLYFVQRSKYFDEPWRLSLSESVGLSALAAIIHMFSVAESADKTGLLLQKDVPLTPERGYPLLSPQEVEEVQSHALHHDGAHSDLFLMTQGATCLRTQWQTPVARQVGMLRTVSSRVRHPEAQLLRSVPSVWHRLLALDVFTTPGTYAGPATAAHANQLLFGVDVNSSFTIHSAMFCLGHSMSLAGLAFLVVRYREIKCAGEEDVLACAAPAYAAAVVVPLCVGIVFGVVGILRRRARLLLLRLTLRLTRRRSVFEAHCLSDPSHPGLHQARGRRRLSGPGLP